MIEFTNEMITAMIGYVSLIFSDLSSLILLVVGVGLALMVVGAIITHFKH